MYDQIDEIEGQIQDFETRILHIKEEKISSDGVYQYLLFFDKLYEQFTDKEKKVLRETAYVDCAFMARRIKADSYLCTGLIDNVCIPNSVFAAYNGIPAGTKKEMSITPNIGHSAKNIKGMAWLNEYRRSLQNAKK